MATSPPHGLLCNLYEKLVIPPKLNKRGQEDRTEAGAGFRVGVGEC